MLKPVVRLFSFFFKELSEVRRQPRLILSLLLGPFLILLLFGVGYQGSIPKFRVALVLPADTSLLPPQMVAELKKAIETNFILVSADANQDEALRKLQNGEVDVVELFPPDVSQVILRVPLGQQSPVVFRYSEVNPQNESWVKYLGYAQVTEINKQILMQIIAGHDPDDPGSAKVAIPDYSASLTGNLKGLDKFVPKLTIKRIPDGTHWVIHEQPALINEYIREFIKAN